MIFITLGSDPLFLKKMFFLPLEKLKTLNKNEVIAVKVAVSAALCDMLPALHNMLAATHHATCWSHKTLMGTPGGLRDPQGGWVLYMKISYGL